MNKQLKEYSKEWLKANLALCTEPQIRLFKRMYYFKNLEASIDEVVDNMNPENYGNAISRVERTLTKAGIEPKKVLAL